MGKLDTFLIIFDHPQAVFYAGHMVRGHVQLVLNDAMTMRGIVMKLFGKGKVHWSVSSGKNRKHYRAEEIYFDCKINLLPERAGQESLILPAGSYNYPFRLDLASGLPSSFEGKYGYVRYLASVNIDRPWKFDHETKAAFTVLSNLDLNREPPLLREPFVLHETKDVGCCLCCISGLVDVTLTINRKCFVPGECIYISSKITNNSNSLIPNCSATLEQYIEFLAQSSNFFSSGQFHSKTKKEVVARVELGQIAAGETEEWNNTSLLVPSIPSSRLQGCQIININYFMVFDVNVNYTDCKLPIEVVIGTIPLQSQYPRAAVISTQPTAPPLLPLQNFQPGGPPPPFPTDSYDMPPPSYEECVSGKVTIKEDTDSDYVRGNMNWAPVYPTYHVTAAPPRE